jgi:hypothetical protein
MTLPYFETPQAVNGSSRLLGAGRTGGSFSETSELYGRAGFELLRKMILLQ